MVRPRVSAGELRRKFPDSIPKVRINIELELDLMKAVDDWGYRHKRATRRATMQDLLRLALEVDGRLTPQTADNARDTRDAQDARDAA